MKTGIGSVLALVLFVGLPVCGDVIYLKNGNVIVAEKAWEEADQVKYQAGSGVQAIPRAAVKRLRGQKASPADPSRKQPVGVEVIRGTGAPGVASAGVRSTPSPAATATKPEVRSSRLQDAAGYQEALRLQRATGKPLALYFYVDWCPYCAQLEGAVLSRPEVKQYLDSLLYVSVNPEHGKAEKALFASFEGDSFPTFLILGKDRPAREIRTSVSADAFVQACKVATQAGSQ